MTLLAKIEDPVCGLINLLDYAIRNISLIDALFSP